VFPLAHRIPSILTWQKREINSLLTPTKLWACTEVLARPCPVPAFAGVYAWFFDSFPKAIPTERLVCCDGLALLYIDISPKRPSVVRALSGQTLRSRLRYHFREMLKVLPYDFRWAACCHKTWASNSGV
jgi:hypothetical protein